MPHTLYPLPFWAELHHTQQHRPRAAEVGRRQAGSATAVEAVVHEHAGRTSTPDSRNQACDPGIAVRSDDTLPEGALLSRFQQLSAWGGSFSAHLLLLVACSMVYLAADSPPEPPLLSTIVTELEEAQILNDLPQVVDTRIVDASVPIATTATKTVVETVENLEARKEHVTLSELAVQEVREDPMAFAPDNAEMDQLVEGIEGTQVVAEGDVGSVDRITVEILARLKGSKVLVAWLLDASESLRMRREQVIARFDRVYQELDELAESHPEALLTGVIGFGEAATFVTEQPTSDRATIREAVRKIPADESGVENVFTAIKTAALQYRPFTRKGYKVMLIVLTDEAGNDPDMLDEAVAEVARHEMPVYVMGPLAPFARGEMKVRWTDGKTGEEFFLPVERGPESVLVELAALPGWFPETRMGLLSSGFGPFGLARIARESGGIYFLHDDGNLEGPRFDVDHMRDHAPDYASAIEYQQLMKKHPLRQAVLRVTETVRQTQLPQPQTEFLAAGIQFEIRDAHQDLQRLYQFLEQAIGELQAVEKFRTQEASARWQAHYDLLCGQLLLRRAWLANSLPLLADMYDAPQVPGDVTCNAWKLAGIAGTALADASPPPVDNHPGGNAPKKSHSRATDAPPSPNEDAASAAEYLKRVVRQHPGTPWANLAQAELLSPVKLQWQESFVVPPEGEKLPWEKAPWKELTDDEKARLLAAKEKFERFRQEQQKQAEEQQRREEVRKEVQRRLPKL